MSITDIVTTRAEMHAEGTEVRLSISFKKDDQPQDKMSNRFNIYVAEGKFGELPNGNASTTYGTMGNIVAR